MLSMNVIKFMATHHGMAKVQYRQNLWVNLYSALKMAKVSIKEQLKHGLLDKDIGKYIEYFFADDGNFPAPQYWPSSLNQFAL